MITITLRQYLKEKGINQIKIAEALGINVSNLKRYDDLSKRSLEELMIISKAIGIDLSELINTTINIHGGIFNSVNQTSGGHSLNIQNSDFEKIITGKEIEVIKRSESEKNLSIQIESLKAEIKRLEALIGSKDETIAAKDEIIQILKNK